MSKSNNLHKATPRQLTDEEGRHYDIAWIVRQNISGGMNERDVCKGVGEAWGLSARKVAAIYKKLKDDLAPLPKVKERQEGSKLKQQPEQPRHKRAILKCAFGEGDEEKIQLAEATAKMILQFASMAESESPELRAEGLAKIMMVAEFCVAGQFFLGDQKDKSGEPRATIETDEGGTSLAAICRKLAPKRDEMGDLLQPAELWPLYIAELDQLGLNPREDKLGVNFEGGSTTKAVFRNTITRERRKETKSAT